MKILTALTHLFIPHDKNEFKPHIFRELAVSIILLGSVFSLGASFGSSFFIHKTVLGAEIASSVLIDLTNESRIAYNQPALIRNEKLDKAAELKGEDMVSKEYFSHDSPDGVTPWYWFRKVGYNFLYAGENLAINFTDSSAVEEAWLNSPKHRENIMNGEFREIGMATVRGLYNNYPTIYIVQLFGTPAYGKTASDKNIIDITPKKKEEILSSTSSEGNVRGESTQSAKPILNNSSSSPVENIPATNTLIQITKTQDFAAVKNIEAEQMLLSQKATREVPTYSTWYERFIFNAPYYVTVLYKILLILILISLILMIGIEIKKQHYIHIFYGVFLLVLLLSFIVINKSFY